MIRKPARLRLRPTTALTHELFRHPRPIPPERQLAGRADPHHAHPDHDDPAIAAQLQSAPAGLKKAIAEQIKVAPKTYDATATPGYLGIPGGPSVNLILAFCWALWVGWIFSTVGAFGGVMAGVGHMTVHGLGAYAKSFGKTPLNKSVTDSVRASNQMLAGLSAVISTFSYYRMKRLVLPLGFALGLGSIVGAFGAVSLTAGKLNFSSYQGYFGLFVLVLGLYAAISLQKSVRDRLEGIPVTAIYYGISWVALIIAVLLLGTGLFNATLQLSEKGFYAMAFALALFGAIAVQKNTRDSLSADDGAAERKRSKSERSGPALVMTDPANPADVPEQVVNNR